ncbi:hypothetical protein RJ639_025471 [Escallonia herrerae]|uniref:Stress-response A/B barrel domain-containing protein n=1 Tax=Escallonia herrerae TaxID=1293975 RepID=A0AA88S6S4_9ASTE|nr:hypothetical protein RJ639_025471 [Escallonia herrerae]
MPPPATHHQMSTTTGDTVEHIVLFKAKPDADPSAVAAMVNGLNSLSSLDSVLHLTAGPLLRCKSDSLTFTHMLHARYRSKDDLRAYSLHPNHVSVVQESKPVLDDIMAVDWLTDAAAAALTPRPGSAMRVRLLKLKEGLGEEEKAGILGLFGNTNFQLSFGENFSPDRAKGYSIGSIAFYPGLGELEVDGNSEIMEVGKDLAESEVVLDFLIPLP